MPNGTWVRPDQAAWRLGGLQVGVVIAALVATAAWFFWPATPAYEYGQTYKFEFFRVSKARTNAGDLVDARFFVFADGSTFSPPNESAGRDITIIDRELPPNTFRLVERAVPRLQIGAYTFDPGGTYAEVRYNAANVDSVNPRVTPRVTPENKPSARR